MSEHRHSHSHSHKHTHHEHRLQQTLWLTILSALINLGLALIKVVAGLWANSHALVADGFHSFSDLLTDVLVYVAAHFGHKDADEKHPYGHERFETAGTLFVSLILVLAGVGIFLDVMEHIGTNYHAEVHYYAIIVIVLSLILNEGLFQLTRMTAERVKSDLLLANAWHHRSDALSSLIVLIGVLASYAGYPKCDIWAAIIVAGLIVKMGIDLTWNSVKELVDTAAPEALVTQMKEVINAVPGVEALHELRTRQMGTKILIDVHLIVGSYLTVSEGHYIGDRVIEALRKHVDQVADIVVHIDPEDDENARPSQGLPTRSIIEEKIRLTASELLKGYAIETIYIHYLDGKIEIDLICQQLSHSVNDDMPHLSAQFSERLSSTLNDLAHCRLLLKI